MEKTERGAQNAAKIAPERLRIGLLSDIHANLPALEAVLRHAARHGCQELWNAGDSTGYSPYPEETVSLLEKAGVISVSGNYDLKILDFPKHRSRWRKEKHPAKYFSFAWTHAHLSSRAKRALAKLPARRLLKRQGLAFFITHGTIVSNEEGLHEETPVARLKELASRIKADVFISGHSHYAFSRSVKRQGRRVLFVNPGSVGRPPEATPLASYAILEICRGRIKVRRFRVRYDPKGLLQRMERERFPRYLRDSVVGNR
jgi:putative phosphoesterase